MPFSYIKLFKWENIVYVAYPPEALFWSLKENKYIYCRWMTSFVYLRNIATSDIPISGFPGRGFIILTKWLARAPNVTYQVSCQSAYWFEMRRILKGFYLIWARRPSWSSDLDPAKKLSFPHPMEASHEIWLQSAQWFQRRRCMKMLTDDRLQTTDNLNRG